MTLKQKKDPNNLNTDCLKTKTPKDFERHDAGGGNGIAILKYRMWLASPGVLFQTGQPQHT